MRYKFTVYFYDTRKACYPGLDTNELWIGNKYISEITSVRDVFDLSEIDKDDLEWVVLIVPFDTKLPIKNINPCPEDLD